LRQELASNWVSVAILVGINPIGAGVADGLAIASLFQLGEPITHALEGLLVVTALIGFCFFLRGAPSRDPGLRAGRQRRSRKRRLPQVLEPRQRRDHSFQLTVPVDS
jgi:hypothetical protein